MGEKRANYYSLFGIFTARANGTKLNQLTDWQSDLGHPSWSSEGKRILFSTFGKAGAIHVMNTDGSNVQLFGLRSMHDLSPDETRIALSVSFASTNRIVVKNVDRTNPRPLTSPNPQEDDRDPVWSADGSKILFERHWEDDVDLFMVNPDRSGLQPVTNLPGRKQDGEWSPDGSQIVFVRRTPAGTDLYIIRSNGTGLRRLTDLRGAVKAPAFARRSDDRFRGRESCS